MWLTTEQIRKMILGEISELPEEEQEKVKEYREHYGKVLTKVFEVLPENEASATDEDTGVMFAFALFCIDLDLESIKRKFK